MLRAMMGKKTWKKIICTGIMYYPYYPFGEPPYPVESCYFRPLSGNIHIGDVFNTNQVFAFKHGEAGDYNIGFNHSKVDGSGLIGEGNPKFKYINKEVKFRIKSDFKIDFTAKYESINIIGKIELLPEYRI